MRGLLLAAAVCAAAVYVVPVCAADAPTVVINLLTSDTEVQPSGLFTRTTHYEIQAMNDAAAAQIAQRAVAFSASLEELDVIEAYTQKADGRKIIVNPNSILTQQPQGAVSIPQFDDQRQKVIVFPNVAGGDTVAFTIRLRATKARIPGQFTYFDIFPLGAAYKDVRETIVAPKSFPLQTETHDVTFEKQETGDNVTYRWRYSAPNPRFDVELPPVSPLDQLPRIFVSSFKDYEELGRVYGAIVAPKETVTNPIRTLANRLTAGITDRRQQAEALYNWVSRNIRYVAIDIGNGGIVPHDADSVLANAYGDCKDHTVLFAALLKARGIDSEVVLINSGNSYTLPNVAALVPLDHAVTWIPEFKLYADTTAGTAPFGTLPFAEYGKPVVHAVSSGTAMARIPVLAPGVATTNVKTAARIDKDGKVTGESTITAAGPFSAALRALGLVIQATGPERLAAAQLQNRGLTGTGSFDVPPPLELKPDYALTTHFAFGPEADWLTGTQIEMVRGISVAELAGDFLMGTLFNERLTEDTSTVCLSGRQTEELSLSGPDDKQFKAPPADITVKTDNLQFSAHWSVTKNTVTLRQEFTSSLQQPLCSGELRKQTAKALAQIRDYYAKSQVSFVAPAGTANKASEDVQAGIAADGKGDLDEAIRLYSSALSAPGITSDDRRIVYYDRGLVYLRERDYAQAITDFSSAIELKKDDFEAVSARARAYATIGSRDKAIADYTSALALKPDDPTLLAPRGVLYAQQRMYREATADLTAVIRLRPDDQPGYLGRANVYLQRNLVKQAIEDCEAAIRLGRRAADCYALTGFAYYVMGKYDDAVSKLSQAIQIQSGNPRSYLERGFVYLAVGKNDDAIADFDKVLSLAPNNSLAVYARGAAKQSRGDQSGGDSDIAAAQKMNQGTAVEIISFGVIAGRYEKGKDDLQSCKEAETNRDVHLGLVFCYRALSAPTLSSAEKAEARTSLGVLYSGQREFEEAIVHFESALELNPKLAASLYGRGIAKLKLGNAVQGNADISAAKAIQANVEMVMANRGITPQ